jgi:tRNA-specific 2-thiouridylase
VRIVHGPDGSSLLRGLDPAKDQSYFLWGLPADMLPALRFPLGELTKPQVRGRARALSLVTAEKPESQEICFVPTGDYRDLLQKRLGAVHPALEPGPLVDRSGTVLGRHDGYAGFTVGQRKGLGGGFAEPVFVLEIRPDTREVVVGPREDLFSDTVDVAELNWLGTPPSPGDVVAVQLRYRAREVAATVVECGDALSLELGEEVAAVTPGQSAVVFEGARVLGGGRIVRAGVRARAMGAPRPRPPA